MTSDGRIILWVLAGLAAFLLAWGLSWFFDNFERRALAIDIGYSSAARRNPFLAAERFLTRLGIPVESLAGRDLLRDLPPSGDTLVVNGLGVLNKERQEALHRWIEAGGRLIVAADALWDGAGPTADLRGAFLARYGMRLREQGGSESSFDPSPERVAMVDVEGYPYQLEVGFDPGYYLEDERGEASDGVAAADQMRLLQYEIGEGILTVSSDNRFLTNGHIGEHDHALFFALLADPPADREVWLLYDSGIPWLGALLWSRAPFAVVSAIGLLLLFLWRLGGRLGPFEPGPAGDRRDLMAHLQASAGFLWRHGQGGRLTRLSRERIERAWLRRHPALREMDQAGRTTWIAERAGVAPGEVQRALYPRTVGEGDLVADTALLQRLWSGLSAPGAAVPRPRRDSMRAGLEAEESK